MGQGHLLLRFLGAGVAGVMGTNSREEAKLCGRVMQEEDLLPIPILCLETPGPLLPSGEGWEVCSCACLLGGGVERRGLRGQEGQRACGPSS